MAGKLGTSGLYSWLQRCSRWEGDGIHFIFLSVTDAGDEGGDMLAPIQIGNDLKG